jgi:pimeloyl-ACP methyl ester carboxylesterase
LSEQPADFIHFHGAGKSTKERARPLLESLSEVVPSIVTFDFSGHGESTGDLKHSSLHKRVLEARVAIEQFTNKEKLTISASSMGGNIALKMLPLYDVKNLVLFAPAIYSDEAFEVPFGQGFTEIIRKPDSWKQSDVFASLETFTGNVLICIGDHDEVIPAGLVDETYKHASNAARKEIVRLKGCPHAMHSWLDVHPSERARVVAKIAECYESVTRPVRS